MSEIISVGLGARAYDIHAGTGLLTWAGELLKPLTNAAILPVVTDEHVAKLHLDTLLNSLSGAGFTGKPIILPPGESSKSFAGLERVTGELLDMGVDRSGLVIALGGGVIGDLTGFAAGVLKRGLAFAQIPTTLLAQVDSSVGGKTAINTAAGKNLVGLFHQPRIVIADTDVLTSLPRRELLAGYAEVAKYGALGGAAFFEWLESNGAKALGGDSAAVVWGALIVWGAGFAIVPISYQTWATTEAADRPEVVGGLLTAAFQVSIAVGAMGGGFVVDRFGPPSVDGAAAFAAVAAAAAIALFTRAPAPRSEMASGEAPAE